MNSSLDRIRRFSARPSAIFKVVSKVWRHPANAGKRWSAIRRLVSSEVRARMGGRPVIVSFGSRSRVAAHLHLGGSWRAVYANPPDFAEMIAWSKLLRPGDLFVDVGANAGLYTIWALDSGATVIAIEPSGVMMNQLKANVALNSASVEALECGVSDKTGSARLGGPDYLRNRLSDNRSGPTGPEESDSLVDVTTLDQILGERSARGVKVDVEGLERKVLEGSVRALSNQAIDILQLEWNETSLEALGQSRAPVADILHEWGYMLCRPNAQGVLEPCHSTAFGRDMFAVSKNASLDIFRSRQG